MKPAACRGVQSGRAAVGADQTPGGKVIMFFLDAVVALAILTVILSVGLLVLKFAFALVLLPLKLVFLLTKGLLALVIALPLMLIIGTVFTALLPLGLILLFLPVIVLGGVACKLVGI